MSDEYTVSVKEAAKRLRVSTRTIRRRLKDGKLDGKKKESPYGKMWFISENEFNQAEAVNEIVDVAQLNQPIPVEKLKNAFIMANQKLVDQNQKLIKQNEILEQKVDRLEEKIDKNQENLKQELKEELKEEFKSGNEKIVSELEKRDKEIIEEMKKSLKEKKEENKGFFSQLFGF